MKLERLGISLSLIGVNFVYALTSFFTRSASNYEFLSKPYTLFLLGAVITMAVYALIWQQIIKRMPVSDAYMFKGTAVIFTMGISVLFFGETLTISNIIGAIIIVTGIALYAKS